MSLINDALQRAKQQTAQPAPGPNLQLRPVEPSQKSGGRIGLALPATLVTILVAGACSYWLTNQDSRATTTLQHARATEVSVRPAVSSPAQISTTRPQQAESAVAAASNAAPAAAIAASTLETPATNSAPVDPPKPAPPKLQAVIFSPARPSAIVSGKTVFVGDTAGEFHVKAISPTTVTLASATQTLVLSLE